jgi:hypothetical protein
MQRSQAQEALSDIRQLLAQNDPGATELWELHANLLQAVHPHATEAGALIASFDFDEALRLLERDPANAADTP